MWPFVFRPRQIAVRAIIGDGAVCSGRAGVVIMALRYWPAASEHAKRLAPAIGVRVALSCRSSGLDDDDGHIIFAGQRAGCVVDPGTADGG